MSLLKREQANASNSACCSYSSPIVHALSKLPDLEKAQLRVTFDLANFIARVVSDQMLRMADHILDWLDIGGVGQASRDTIVCESARISASIFPLTFLLLRCWY